ncbi:hypothetical protein KYB31_04040 [Clostridium felsineum]|uniref:hypothetical protein n=1 Tax=Clostridium felsineum TaxID=36839 RepID=UPI00214D6ACA|nr:hypothetical protein [Clostridium felsineum]MCR3758168.1 hypothetical protein [Clostridium felsineum]
MDGKSQYVVVAALITSSGALIGIIINIFINLSQSKKQRRAEIITSNRVEWMQKLKEYICEYVGMTTYYYDKQIPENSNQFLERLYLMTAKIKLHLNFNDKRDEEIIKTIEILNNAYEDFLQLKKHENVFSDDKNKKHEDCKKLIEFYLYKYPEEIGKCIGKKIVDKSQIDINNKEECKKFYMDLMSNEDEYYEKISKEIIKYVNLDIKSNCEKIKKLSKLIILLSQVYLKTEWERVKIEAEGKKIRKKGYNKKYNGIRNSVKFKIEKIKNSIVGIKNF